ncbi:MAG: carbon-nitrogen hydrolase family protein [Solirubrobacteraceae bacterium]|nr:carbon-nitrogen hydrolase family protein [Solirubrobacteraceae bacterium]
MRVAAIQLTAGADIGANLAQALAAVRAAAADGAQLVVLPEKWLAIGGATALRPAAQLLDGPVVGQLQALAAELGIDLIAGSIPEAADPGDADQRLRNTSLHLTPAGEVAAAYRKVHLFDADVAGVRYRESDAERPGDHPVTATLADPFWVAGLTICFDLRFPGLYGALASAGATLLTIPAAFTLATTRAHWEVLVRARAIEHGAYVIAANQSGTHADGTASGGQSLIVSPWGEVLAAAPEKGAATIVADLDPAAVAHAREALPTAALARPEAYQARPVPFD